MAGREERAERLGSRGREGPQEEKNFTKIQKKVLSEESGDYSLRSIKSESIIRHAFFRAVSFRGEQVESGRVSKFFFKPPTHFFFSLGESEEKKKKKGRKSERERQPVNLAPLLLSAHPLQRMSPIMSAGSDRKASVAQEVSLGRDCLFFSIRLLARKRAM